MDSNNLRSNGTLDYTDSGLRLSCEWHFLLQAVAVVTVSILAPFRCVVSPRVDGALVGGVRDDVDAGDHFGDDVRAADHIVDGIDAARHAAVG